MSGIRLRIALLAAALVLIPALANAHAHLDHAAPAAGTTVAAAPREVSIWFTEALEPKFSSIDVRDAKGVSMITGPAVLAAGNTAQLIAALKPLPPGTYKVIWKVVSVDTHRTQGEFVFTVGR